MSVPGLWRLLIPRGTGPLLVVGAHAEEELVEEGSSRSEVLFASSALGELDKLERRFAEAGLTNLTALGGRGSSLLGRADGSIEAMVLQKGWSSVLGYRRVRDLLLESSRLLSPEGVLCLLTVAPRWAGGPVRMKISEGDRLTPALLPASRLQKLGFGRRRIYAALPGTGGSLTLVEIRGEGSRRDLSVDLPGSSMAARVRRLLVREGMLAPLFPTLLFKGEERPGLFSDISREVVLGVAGSHDTLRRRAVEKTVLRVSGAGNLSLEVEAGAGDPVRIEVAIRPPTRERERRAVRILGELSAGPERDPRLPRVRSTGDVAGFPYVVEERLPGVPFVQLLREGADARVERTLLEASAFLVSLQGLGPPASAEGRLHRRRERVRDNLDAVACFVRAPDEQRVFETVGARITGALERLGATLAPTLSHGDFGPQNLLVNPATGELTGVVDWDLSSQNGVPLVDLAHLLVGVPWKRGELALVPALVRVLFDEAAHWLAHPAIVNYRKAISVPDDALEAIRLLVWVEWMAPHRDTARATDLPWIQRNIHAFLRHPVVRGTARGKG